MTTFEILTIVFYAVVVMIGYLICRGIATVIDNQQETDSNLRKMDAGLNKRLEDISQQLNNIEDNILDESEGISALVGIVDKMHRNLCVEIADKMVDRAYPPTCVTPCNPPDNIRKWDCVNCPKRSACGTWSTNTSIKAKDAPLQERFNDNKED